MKILIVVLACKSSQDYRDLDDCGRSTWGNIANSNPNIVDVLHTYAVPSPSARDPLVRREGNDIIVNIKEEYDNTSRKNIDTLIYINKHYPDIDYVYRTNLSSYINIDNLVKYLSTAPRTGFYSGQRRSAPYQNFKFASGSGFTMSRDVVDLVAQNKDNINLRAPDDLPLGRFLHQSNIEFTHLDWHRMNNTFSNTDFNNFPKDRPQYRLRTYPKFGGDRREDVKKMKHLHNIFYE
jgi:hypothetical protein